jgi:Fe-S cluster assembly iron-binding protein IscA
MSVDMLAGSVVDLVNEGLKGKTLTVKSPKASGECGCGESVTF